MDFLPLAECLLVYGGSTTILLPNTLPLPATLMIDLRRRIAASPTEHVRSPRMDYALVRMMTWWQHHTVTSAWRSLKAHVRVTETSTDLADALADFLWNVRGILGTATDGDQP
jgi:hypothetical protein